MTGELLRWEQLSPSYGVYIGSEYGFTMDTLLLAEFSKPKKGETCADFGTGCGAIPIIWQINAAPGQTYGIEIQQEAAHQAERSIKKNHLQDTVLILCRDIRDHREFLPHQKLDRIACNPPYKARGAGLINMNAAKRTARHEETLTPSDIAKAAAYTLKFGGSLCICQRPERLTDFMTIFHDYKLEPKRLQFVQQNQKSAPSLFLLEARLGGKSGLHTEPALMVEAWSGYNVTD